MAVGLTLSGLIAWYTFTSGLWQKILTGPGMTICIIAELAMVFVLSAAIRKLPEGIACLLFIGYAALNGLTPLHSTSTSSTSSSTFSASSVASAKTFLAAREGYRVRRFQKTKIQLPTLNPNRASPW